MEILADCAGGLGDGSSQRGRNRAACNGRLEVEIPAVNGEDSTPLLVPLTIAQLKAFGLLGQDGKPDCGKLITLSCSVPQQPQDEEESDDDHGGEVSANFEGSPTSLKRQKTGRADTVSKHPTKRLRGHSTTSTNAPAEANRDGTHESNYETGGPDFDDIPPHAQPRLDQSPVADQI